MTEVFGKRRFDHVREVLFIIPTNLTRPYFSSLYATCESVLFRRFQGSEVQVRPVLRSVEREFDTAQIRAVIEREFSLSDRIDFLVVAPTENKDLDQAVSEILAVQAKKRDRPLPAVALSLPFHNREVFESQGLQVPPTVVSKSHDAAFELGRNAIDDFVKSNAKSKDICVLLIPGKEGRRDSRTRIAYFWRGIVAQHQKTFGGETSSKLRKLRCAECHWSRVLARLNVKALLDNKKTPRIDIIFGSNDEIALGAYEAVRRSSQQQHKSCLIYGFDSISEMENNVLQGHPNLKGTVKQSTKAMADALAEMVKIGLVDGNVDAMQDRMTDAEVIRQPDRSYLQELESQFDQSGYVEPFSRSVWLTVEEVVAYYDSLPLRNRSVSPETLRQYRRVSQGGRLGSDGCSGRDRFGRFWREVRLVVEMDSTPTEVTRYFYLESSL